MKHIVFVTAVLAVVQAVYCYVLLTASIDDVKNIAYQLATSRLGDKVKRIVMRASDVFNKEVGNSENSQSYEESGERSRRGRKNNDRDDQRRNLKEQEKPPQGHNASFYLNMIQKVFENV